MSFYLLLLLHTEYCSKCSAMEVALHVKLCEFRKNGVERCTTADTENKNWAVQMTRCAHMLHLLSVKISVHPRVIESD